MLGQIDPGPAEERIVAKLSRTVIAPLLLNTGGVGAMSASWQIRSSLIPAGHVKLLSEGIAAENPCHSIGL